MVTKSFCSALKTFEEHCGTRRTTIEQAAKEQSVSVGEADLRRMKRQFSSLKNTFLHYEVKDEFIAALADGLPNGTEDIQLQQFEDEAQRNIEMLREWKSKNLAKQEEIQGLIDAVDTVMGEVDADTKNAMQDLRILFDEIAEFEDFERNAALDIEPGMDEEECRKVIEEESARATELETRLLASLEELKVLESRAPAMRQELDMLKEEYGDVQSALASVRAENQSSNGSTNNCLGETSRQRHARAKTAAWASENISVLQSINGVDTVEISGTIVKLTNVTMFPLHSILKIRSSEALVASNMGSVSHKIELVLDEKTGHVIGGTVAPVPPCYPSMVDEIIQNTLVQNRHATVERVLGEVRMSLAGYYHRQALIEHDVSAAAESVNSVSPDATMFTCKTQKGIIARVKMQSWWPENDDQFEISHVETPMMQDMSGMASKSFDNFAALIDFLDNL